MGILWKFFVNLLRFVYICGSFVCICGSLFLNLWRFVEVFCVIVGVLCVIVQDLCITVEILCVYFVNLLSSVELFVYLWLFCVSLWLSFFVFFGRF